MELITIIPKKVIKILQDKRISGKQKNRVILSGGQYCTKDGYLCNYIVLGLMSWRPPRIHIIASLFTDKV